MLNLPYTPAQFPRNSCQMIISRFGARVHHERRGSFLGAEDSRLCRLSMSRYSHLSFLQIQNLHRECLVRLVPETRLTDLLEIDLAERALSLHLGAGLDFCPQDRSSPAQQSCFEYHHCRNENQKTTHGVHFGLSSWRSTRSSQSASNGLFRVEACLIKQA